MAQYRAFLTAFSIEQPRAIFDPSVPEVVDVIMISEKLQ